MSIASEIVKEYDHKARPNIRPGFLDWGDRLITVGIFIGGLEKFGAVSQYRKSPGNTQCLAGAYGQLCVLAG